MRAKSKEKQNFEIVDYSLMISKSELKNLEVGMSEDEYEGFDVYAIINFYNSEFIFRISESIIKYFVTEYNIKSFDEIIGLEI